VLSARGISFGYRRRALVAGLDIDAAPGEVLAVIGPNGAGKSTLIKVLAQLLTPFAGTVTLAGASLIALHRHERARRVAYLPQQSRSAPMTVFEAVLLGRVPHLSWKPSAEDLSIVDSVLERFGLAPLAMRPCTELSGGELQKVLIGRALAQSPSLLLLDEPVNHLDLANQLEVLGIVRETTRREGLVTLTVIHDLNLALRHADRFLLLDGCGGADSGAIHELDPARISTVYRVPVVRGEVAGHTLLVPR